jgi:perosamine synthetase
MFLNRELLGREKQISEDNWRSYKDGLCPVAEDLQSRLLQFKTDYWDWGEAEIQAEALRKTITALS